jgi:hypothetical protein
VNRTPIAIIVGPDPLTGRPRIDVELADGTTVIVALDSAHAKAISGRLQEIVDGRISARVPSRRVLEIELPHVAEVAEEPPMAVGGTRS